MFLQRERPESEKRVEFGGDVRDEDGISNSQSSHENIESSYEYIAALFSSLGDEE